MNATVLCALHALWPTGGTQHPPTALKRGFIMTMVARGQFPCLIPIRYPGLEGIESTIPSLVYLMFSDRRGRDAPWHVGMRTGCFALRLADVWTLFLSRTSSPVISSMPVLRETNTFQSSLAHVSSSYGTYAAFGRASTHVDVLRHMERAPSASI